MAATSFRLIRKALAPRWLTEGDGGLVGYSLDLVKDAFVRRLELGHLARFPLLGGVTAPPDALDVMGRDRRVVPAISETDAAFAARLITWLDDRRTAGNPFTLMARLAEYTGPLPSFRTVDVRGNWYSRAADGTETALVQQGNWDWDGDGPARWARFWVIVYPNGLWAETPQEYGDGSTWGEEGHVYGVTTPAEHVQTMRFLVRDWKPAHARCVNIIAAFDPASFDPASPEPDGTWEHWGTDDGGVRVPSRLDTARFFAGVT